MSVACGSSEDILYFGSVAALKTKPDATQRYFGFLKLPIAALIGRACSSLVRNASLKSCL